MVEIRMVSHRRFCNVDRPNHNNQLFNSYVGQPPPIPSHVPDALPGTCLVYAAASNRLTNASWLHPTGDSDYWPIRREPFLPS